MNKFKAIITKIDTNDTLNIVKFNVYGHTLSMMSLGLSDDVKTGSEVVLAINPTHIAIAKDFSGIVSYSNQIKAKIISCENGKLLCSIKLAVEDVLLESIITLESAVAMDLKSGDDVTMMIKASELSILEVL